jgi:cell division septum initiation protein DivIVA
MTEKQRLTKTVSVLSENECAYLLKFIEKDYPIFVNEVQKLLDNNFCN